MRLEQTGLCGIELDIKRVAFQLGISLERYEHEKSSSEELPVEQDQRN